MNEINEIKERISSVLRQMKDQAAVARGEIIRHQNVLRKVGSKESEAMLQRAADKCDTWSKNELSRFDDEWDGSDEKLVADIFSECGENIHHYAKRVTDIERLADSWLGSEPNTDIDGLIKQIAESHRKMEDSVCKLDELMKGLDK